MRTPIRVIAIEEITDPTSQKIVLFSPDEFRTVSPQKMYLALLTEENTFQEDVLFEKSVGVTGDILAGGNVTLSSTSLLRLDNTTDVSLSSTNHPFQIGPTSGTNLRMDGNEIQAVNNGVESTLVLNQAGGAVGIGGQLAFPATQNPSANANTLDDYEEGTFTPTIIGTGTAGTGTYTTQFGRYTKIGNLVWFTAALVWSAHTGTGNILVAGLPFTAASGVSMPVAGYGSGLTFGGALGFRVTAAATTCQPFEMATGAAIASVAMDTAATIVVGGTYSV